jgi:C4-dicarboxylate transporter
VRTVQEFIQYEGCALYMSLYGMRGCTLYINIFAMMGFALYMSLYGMRGSHYT